MQTYKLKTNSSLKFSLAKIENIVAQEDTVKYTLVGGAEVEVTPNFHDAYNPVQGDYYGRITEGGTEENEEVIQSQVFVETFCEPTGS